MGAGTCLLSLGNTNRDSWAARHPPHSSRYPSDRALSGVRALSTTGGPTPGQVCGLSFLSLSRPAMMQHFDCSDFRLTLCS